MENSGTMNVTFRETLVCITVTEKVLFWGWKTETSPQDQCHECCSTLHYHTTILYSTYLDEGYQRLWGRYWSIRWKLIIIMAKPRETCTFAWCLAVNHEYQPHFSVCTCTFSFSLSHIYTHKILVFCKLDAKLGFSRVHSLRNRLILLQFYLIQEI